MYNNNKLRNIAVSSMAATAAVAAVAPAVSAESVNFTDVEKGDTHAEGIMALAQEGIVSGYADGSFGVYDNVTRQQVAVMLYQALNLETPADADKILEVYSDVNGDSLYAEKIAAVTSAGAFVGSDGQFMPGKNINRQQMASVLVSGFNLKEYDNGEDVEVNLDNVADSHKDAVQVLANLGLTVELDDFRPGEEISRGAFATMLHGTLSTIEKAPVVVESVEAINTTVDENGTLQFAINDQKEAADLQALKDAGYTVEFKASKAVFGEEGSKAATSNTGVVNATDGDEFYYQVVVSKDDQTVAKSERQTVKVEDYASIVTEITDINVEKGETPIKDGNVALNDKNVKLSVDGKVKSSDDVIDLTDKAEFSTNRPAVLTVDKEGNITTKAKGTAIVTVTAGEETQTVNLKVGAEREVDAANSVVQPKKATVGTGKEVKITVNLNDQYGLPFDFDSTEITAENGETPVMSGSPVVEQVKEDGQEVSGKYEITFNAVDEPATGDVTVKAGDTEIGNVNMTVKEAGEIDSYELETDHSEFDLRTEEAGAATAKVTLKAYDEDGLEVPLEGEFAYESSDEDVVTVDENGTVTLAADAKAGDKATVVANEVSGAFKEQAASVEFTVIDSTPAITDVTFTSIETVTEAKQLDLSSILNVKAGGSEGAYEVGYTVADNDTLNIYEADADGTLPVNEEGDVTSLKLGTAELSNSPNNLDVKLSQDGDVTSGEVTVDISEGEVDKGTFNIGVVDNENNFKGDQTFSVDMTTQEENQ